DIVVSETGDFASPGCSSVGALKDPGVASAIHGRRSKGINLQRPNRPAIQGAGSPSLPTVLGYEDSGEGSCVQVRRAHGVDSQRVDERTGYAGVDACPMGSAVGALECARVCSCIEDGCV